MGGKNSTLSDIIKIWYVGRKWCPDIEKCLSVAIFKMVATILQKLHCPISSKFDMWVDNDVPNWFPTLKIFYRSPFLAHLAFRPSELLSSLFVRRPSVNISHFNLLLRNHWTNCNQTMVEWSLDDPLSKLCPVIPTSNQDGRQATWQGVV